MDVNRIGFFFSFGWCLDGILDKLDRIAAYRDEPSRLVFDQGCG